MKEEVFYIITLFDKKYGIILTQDVVVENKAIDFIYDTAASALVNKYPKKEITLIGEGLSSKKYRLSQIFDINKAEVNDHILRIFVKKAKIHI